MTPASIAIKPQGFVRLVRTTTLAPWIAVGAMLKQLDLFVLASLIAYLRAAVPRLHEATTSWLDWRRL